MPTRLIQENKISIDISQDFIFSNLHFKV